DPATPEEPLPESRWFGVLWALGLAVAIPLWVFALIVPGHARVAMSIADLIHQAAFIAASALAFHFAMVLAARQEAAWERVRPSLTPGPPRLAPPPKPGPAPAAAPIPRLPRPASDPMRQAEPAPRHDPDGATEPLALSQPTSCPVCKAALSARRCEK